MKKILIAYFTKTNSTKAIGEKLSELLTAQDFEVDFYPIDEVHAIADYEGVIIGSPIHGMRWATEAVNFVTEHEDELLNTKVAYYQTSYPGKIGGKFWQNAVSKAFTHINKDIVPITTGHVGGRSEKPMTGFPRVLFGIKKDAPIDVIDWNMVATFAQEVANNI